MPRPTEVKLSDLPGVGLGGDVLGLDIGDSGWTGNRHRLPNDPNGYRILADGHLIRTTEGVPLVVAPGTGFTEIVEPRILMGSWKGVSAGREKTKSIKGDVIRLVGGSIHGAQGKWGIHVRNFDMDLEDMEFDLDIGEHNVYWGGPAWYGARMRRCVHKRANYEAAKVGVYRPWESPRYINRSRLVFEDNTFDNCEAGIVIQGAGSDVEIRRCVFRDTVSPIRIDNGLSSIRPPGQGRYWDHLGVPEGHGAANRRILIVGTAIEKAPGGKAQLIRIGKEKPDGPEWDHYVALAFEMRRCGLWGEDSFVSVPERNTLGSHRVHDNNTDSIRDYCRTTLGMAAMHDARGA